jgi:hypothetical protein
VKLTVRVGTDEVIQSLRAPVILGPCKGSHTEGWLLYLPGQTPCICDSFDDAANLMRSALARKAQRS